MANLFFSPNLTSEKKIYFLHIGKCGGTSFDLMMKEVCREINVKYIGFCHFDYSYIETEGTPQKDIDFVTILRHPVSRAYSQFHFSQTLDWTKGLLMRNQTFSEHIRDKESIKEYSQALADGESGFWWLCGIHPGNWVLSDDTNQEYKSTLLKDKKERLILAARNLDKTIWFGILEDTQRSMELLKHTLGLERIPDLPKRNVTKKYQPIRQDDIEIVEEYLKGDIWLYKYSLLLFEARWDAYKGNPYVHPELPNFE